MGAPQPWLAYSPVLVDQGTGVHVTHRKMCAVRSAVIQDLPAVARWIRKPQECERGAASQVAMPIDLVALSSAIGFTERKVYVLGRTGRLIGFGA